LKIIIQIFENWKIANFETLKFGGFEKKFAKLKIVKITILILKYWKL
jgi:hypothetical protein